MANFQTHPYGLLRQYPMCAKGVRVFFEGFGEESLASNCFALLVWKVRLWLGRRENSGETLQIVSHQTPGIFWF